MRVFRQVSAGEQNKSALYLMIFEHNRHGVLC